jgi:hypothetical protein
MRIFLSWIAWSEIITPECASQSKFQLRSRRFSSSSGIDELIGVMFGQSRFNQLFIDGRHRRVV